MLSSFKAELSIVIDHHHRFNVNYSKLAWVRGLLITLDSCTCSVGANFLTGCIPFDPDSFIDILFLLNTFNCVEVGSSSPSVTPEAPVYLF